MAQYPAPEGIFIPCTWGIMEGYIFFNVFWIGSIIGIRSCSYFFYVFIVFGELYLFWCVCYYIIITCKTHICSLYIFIVLV